MPTMKLFSLLMGSGQAHEEQVSTEEIPTMSTLEVNSPEEGAVSASPNFSINFDKLRRIFQTLSSGNDKSPDSDVDDEPWQLRQKFRRIFDRKFPSGLKPNGTSKHRTISLKLSKERILSLLRRQQQAVPPDGDAKPARHHKFRLTAIKQITRLRNSVRREPSGLIKRPGKQPTRADIEEDLEIRLPSMKTKKRSTRERSRGIITEASKTARKDVVEQLQMKSSQHYLDQIDFRSYQFPFENLVFEGGGAKVHTYIGAIKCIEEAGIKPRRLAGTSAGAITAGLLAVGYTSEEIHILYEYDVEYNVKDGSCGLLSLLPNMFRHYGWHPGERATRWFGECLAVKTGDPDITFQQIYDIYGVELCIVAVNLTNRCEEYFHPKTSPDMPVKLAVRMSSSLPGLFQPVKQGTNLYIDGGVLCNFPVHVFDGWWLSMDPDDAYYKRMGSLENLPQIMERKNRFGEFNEKTLGFCMFSNFDDKALRFELEKRHKLEVTKRPNTKLAAKRMKQSKARNIKQSARDDRLEALDHFFKILRKVDIDNKGLDKITLVEEFELAHQLPDDTSVSSTCSNTPEHHPMTRSTHSRTNSSCNGSQTTINTVRASQSTGGLHDKLLKANGGKTNTRIAFTQRHAEIMFGQDVEFIKLIKNLPTDENGRVSNSSIITLLKKNGVDVQGIMGDQYCGNPEVSGFGSFFMSVQESLMNSARRVYLRSGDLNRTVGINTDYIKMDDFSIERDDQDFLIQQGYAATEAFLRYWINQNHPSNEELSTPVSSDSEEYSSTRHAADSPAQKSPTRSVNSSYELLVDVEINRAENATLQHRERLDDIQSSGSSDDEIITAEIDDILADLDLASSLSKDHFNKLSLRQRDNQLNGQPGLTTDLHNLSDMPYDQTLKTGENDSHLTDLSSHTDSTLKSTTVSLQSLDSYTSAFTNTSHSRKSYDRKLSQCSTCSGESVYEDSMETLDPVLFA